MVSTSFWSDNYTADLDPIEKLLFLYLLTCERSTLAGVYELPIKLMAVETGIENEMVKKILGRFEEDGKVKYEGGWVAVKNFLKHHEHGSPTVKKGIEDAIKSAPVWAKDFIGKGIDTLTPSSSSFTINSAAREVYEAIEEQEKPRSQAKYPHSKEVFSWFPDPQKSWEALRNVQEREYGEYLYDRGEKVVRGIISFCIKYGDMEFFPAWRSPSKLEKNWQPIQDFAKRNNL